MKRMVCHGDSLTEGADIEPAYRWPSLLENALNIEVVNTGIGGDTTGGLMSRFPTDVVSRKPDTVILMGGTNDLWWDLPVNYVMANLYTMAYQAQYHGMAPLFGMPMPFVLDRVERQPFRQPEKGYHDLQEKIGMLVSRLKIAAADSEIPVLDFHALFMESDGTVPPDCYLEDGLHLNPNGHRKMAVLIADSLRNLFLLP